MSPELAAKLTDPATIVAVLVAIAVFGTLYSLAMPFLERGDLGRRMRAVSTERDQIRARERARMTADEAQGKATFVSILGPDRARAQAALLTEQAIEHLAIFDDKADLLRSAARFVVERRR